MAVTVITSSTGGYSSVTGPNVTASWTPLENDLVIVFVGSTSTVANGSGVSGWADTGIGIVDPGDSSCAMKSVWHLVTAGEETGSTTSWNLANLFAGIETGRYWMIVLRGVDSSSPIDAVGSWFQETTDNAAEFAAVGTDVDNGSLVVRCIMSDGASRTFTTPAGHTKLQDGGSNNGGWLGYLTTPTTAGVATPAAATTMSSGDEAISFSVAVRMASSPANIPVADAGENQTGVVPGQTVTLDASESTDDGSITGYDWEQTIGSPTVTLSGSGATRTFTAPPTLTGTILTFQVTVTDNDSNTDTDTCTVAIEPASMRIMTASGIEPAYRKIKID